MFALVFSYHVIFCRKYPIFFEYPNFLLKSQSQIPVNPGNEQILAIDFFNNPPLSWVKFNTQGEQYGEMVAGNTLEDDSDQPPGNRHGGH
jgi:hypothetical protein